MVSIYIIIIILGVVLFINGCGCSSPAIIPKLELDEKKFETNYYFPQIDPDIAEDSKLTTVSDKDTISMKSIF